MRIIDIAYFPYPLSKIACRNYLCLPLRLSVPKKTFDALERAREGERGMFEELTNRFDSIFKKIRGQGKISGENIAEAMRDVKSGRRLRLTLIIKSLRSS